MKCYWISENGGHGWVVMKEQSAFCTIPAKFPQALKELKKYRMLKNKIDYQLNKGWVENNRISLLKFTWWENIKINNIIRSTNKPKIANNFLSRNIEESGYSFGGRP